MTKEQAINLIDIIRMGYICDPHECGAENARELCDIFKCDDFHEACVMAIEALKKYEKFGTCKECDDADFCYNRKDACYCLRHNHIMYSDDTCSYFYRDEDWSEE